MSIKDWFTNKHGKILKKVTERWGRSHYIDKLPVPKCGMVNLFELEDNQAVVYGDGKSYYFRLTKRPAKNK